MNYVTHTPVTSEASRAAEAARAAAPPEPLAAQPAPPRRAIIIGRPGSGWTPAPAPEPIDPAVEKREAGLDQAALLKAVRNHQNQLAGFDKKLSDENPPDTSPPLPDQARQWMERFDRSDQPGFRRPETESLYRQAVDQEREHLLSKAGESQAKREDAWREKTLESDLNLMIENMFRDPKPQRLADLDSAIETYWSGEAKAEHRAEMRDRSYDRIAHRLLDNGNLSEAESLFSQYHDRFRPETAEKLAADLDRKESELVLSHTALAEVLPDLARDETTAIMSGQPGNEMLDGLYQTAAEFWDLPGQWREDFQRQRDEAKAARQWLDQPERAFRPLSALRAEAERELGSDPAQQKRLELVTAALDQQQTELNNDPLQYVEKQRDVLIKQLLAKGGLSEENQPSLTQFKIALGRSLAKKLGLEDRGQVLSRREADQYQQQLAESAGPDQRLEIIGQARDRLGRYADRAFRQLGLPPEEVLAARLHQHPDPSVRGLGRLAFEHLKADENQLAPWLRLMAQNEADDSPCGQALLERLAHSGWTDQKAWAELWGLRNLSAAVLSGALARGDGQPGQLAARALTALSADGREGRRQ